MYIIHFYYILGDDCMTGKPIAHGSWGDWATITKIPESAKRVSCSMCVYYNSDDSCQKMPIVIKDVGYNFWRHCSYFKLGDNWTKDEWKQQVSIANQYEKSGQNCDSPSKPKKRKPKNKIDYTSQPYYLRDSIKQLRILHRNIHTSRKLAMDNAYITKELIEIIESENRYSHFIFSNKPFICDKDTIFYLTNLALPEKNPVFKKRTSDFYFQMLERIKKHYISNELYPIKIIKRGYP